MGIIITKHGEKKELRRLFNTSLVTVRKALNGSNKSALAQRIRTAALERGGAEVSESNTQRQPK